jgi:GNAT superfamily N-acetyltransferase
VATALPHEVPTDDAAGATPPTRIEPTMDQPVPRTRVVDATSAERATAILAGAFHRDPIWSWAFPDGERRLEQHRALWGLFVDAAIRYPGVRMNDSSTAVALWIPPGGSELTEEGEEQLAALVVSLPGDGAARALDAFAAFDRARPRHVPHYYLSLLGTDPQHLGHGHGLRLLEDNLVEIDSLGMPAYLEASNVANVPLYARYGFAPHGVVRITGGPDAVTMWRDPRR